MLIQTSRTKNENNKNITIEKQFKDYCCTKLITWKI